MKPNMDKEEVCSVINLNIEVLRLLAGISTATNALRSDVVRQILRKRFSTLVSTPQSIPKNKFLLKDIKNLKLEFAEKPTQRFPAWEFRFSDLEKEYFKIKMLAVTGKTGSYTSCA